jgi:3'-5' exoribonuclease
MNDDGLGGLPMTKLKKPPLLKLSEFQQGQYGDCYAQLSVRTRGSTRDGKPYYICRFRDPRREVGVMVWADSGFFQDCQEQWRIGQFFKLRGIFGEHAKYGPQFEAEQARPIEERDRSDGFSELDFLQRSRFDPEQMFAELDALVVAEIQDLPLRQLTQKLLHENSADLKILPASTRHAYPFVGGWLEHTLNVAKNCVLLANQYARHFDQMKPQLNRDLIVASAALHDIGRVKSVDTKTPGQPPSTGIAGELFGHVYLGYNLIHSAANNIPELDAELLDLLLHIVVSHLRHSESGTSRLDRSPRIPEGLILLYADELDTRFEMHARCLGQDTSDGPFTDRDPILGYSLLKKRKK